MDNISSNVKFNVLFNLNNITYLYRSGKEAYADCLLLYGRD